MKGQSFASTREKTKVMQRKRPRRRKTPIDFPRTPGRLVSSSYYSSLLHGNREPRPCTEVHLDTRKFRRKMRRKASHAMGQLYSPAMPNCDPNRHPRGSMESRRPPPRQQRGRDASTHKSQPTDHSISTSNTPFSPLAFTLPQGFPRPLASYTIRYITIVSS